jgi:hypothetical protein
MELPPIRIGSRVFTALFPDLMRPMRTDERRALKESIRKRGVLVPVLVDEKDRIIDGINRAMICAELGYPRLPAEVRANLSLDQKRELAQWMNYARRHLSPEERAQVREQDRLRRVAKRMEGRTIQSIAEEEGVPIKQVHRDVEPVLSCDKTDSPGVEADTAARVIGKDGKSYPARKPRRKASAPAMEPSRLDTFVALWSTFTDDEKAFLRRWITSH